MVEIIFSIYVKANDNRKKQHEVKILFTNQRPPAEPGPGPFEGPASYPQLCWWSLIKANALVGTANLDTNRLDGYFVGET